MKTIQFKRHGTGRYSDVSPFPLGDLELELNGLPNASGDLRFCAFVNGMKCADATVTSVKNRVKIPHDKLKAGVFSCRVTQFCKGEEVKRFNAEDLLIAETCGQATADPEIARMERMIAELFEQVEALKNALAGETEARRETENSIAALRGELANEKTEREALEKRLATLEENNDILNG